MAKGKVNIGHQKQTIVIIYKQLGKLPLSNGNE